MVTLKRKAGSDRILRLCRAERARYTLSGPDKSGTYWFFDENRTGRGAASAAERDNALGIRIAFAVLEQIGVEDAHDYDWHLFCDQGAEHMVEEIVSQDLEVRRAAVELAPVRALFSLALRPCR